MADITGTTNNDEIVGTENADNITSLEGQDQVNAGGGNDTVNAGPGGDGIYGGDGDDTLNGEGDNDTLAGGLGADTLNGGDGNDNLNGSGTGFTLSTFFIPNPNPPGPSIQQTAFTTVNWMINDGSVDILNGGAGDDTVFAHLGDSADGGDGNDTLTVYLRGLGAGITADLSVNPQAALAAISGGSYVNFERVNVYATDFNDTVLANATGSSAILWAGDDSFTGGIGNDTAVGGMGADTLNGGDGNDSLYADDNLGTNGFLSQAAPDNAVDTVNGGVGNDTVYISGGDIADGGDGTDTVFVGFLQATAGVSADFSTNSEAALEAASGASLANFERYSVWGSRFNDTFVGDGGVNNISGDAGDDTLSGGGSGDLLRGATGRDSLDGGDGNDVLYGGEGADTIRGGLGNDTIHGDQNGDNQPVTGRGPDTAVFAGLRSAYTLNQTGANTWTVSGPDGIDTLTDIEFARFDDQTVTLSANPGILYDGGSGNDYSGGSAGQDDLRGHAGDDNLNGGAENDTGSGGAGNDYVDGGDGSDRLYGDDGDDRLNGGAGDDIVDGGDGANDQATFYDSTVGVTVDLTLQGSAQNTGQGNDTLLNVEGLAGSGHDDTLIGNAGGNYLFGGGGNDNLQGGEGDDYIDGSEGDDTVDGGAGAGDMVSFYGASTGVTVDLNLQGSAQNTGQGNDTLTNFENIDGSNLYSDTLHGNGANNYIDGKGGDDTITGAGGTDNLRGGDGNDNLSGGSENDNLNGGLGNDVMDGGAGDADNADFYDATSAVTVDLRITGQQNTGQGLDTLTGFENLVGSHNFGDNLTGSDANNFISGDEGDDTIHGAGGADYLTGYIGNDSVYGDEGDDALVGGAGDDLVDGGAGTADRVDFLGSANSITANLSLTTAQNTGEGMDTILNVENITGSQHNDTFTGTEGNNYIDGQAGNDTMYGLGGNDGFDGAIGDDYIDGGSGSDNVNYYGAAGGVTISLAVAGAQNTGGAGTDTLVGIEHLNGSLHSDTFTGDGNANNLSGDQGHDTLNGEGGNDNLNGGAGDDILRGGAGADFMNGGSGNDTFEGGSEVDTVGYGDATSGVTVNLNTVGVSQNTGGSGFDTLSGIENLNGSAHADSFTGDGNGNNFFAGAGNDTLSGGGGNDFITGGLGDDVMDGGLGTDMAQYQDSTVAVTVSLALQGSAQNTGSGNDTLTGFEQLSGSNFDDTLTGDGLNNFLSGAGGNDTLNGGLGNDNMQGGVGNDTLNGGDGFDTANYGDATVGVTVDLNSQGVAQNTGWGMDTLNSVENIAGGGFDDVLIGDGLSNFNTGNAGNDTMLGNGGDDQLTGGLGNDTLNGGDGIDTANYGDANVAVTVNLNLQGAAQATGWGSDTLSNIESVFGGTGADTLTGDANNNVLNGNNGNDTVSGGDGDDAVRGQAGDDVISGGANNDFLFGGFGNDTIDGGTGIDRIGFALAATDPQVGVTVNLSLEGVAQNTGHGTDTISGVEHISATIYNDNLTGNAADNWLANGVGGDDTMSGGAGDDLLDVSNGNHVVDGGADTDTVGYNAASAAVSVSLALQGGVQATGVGNLTMTNVENLSGSDFDDTLTGDDNANMLMGSAGSDTLAGGAGNDTLGGDALLYVDFGTFGTAGAITLYGDVGEEFGDPAYNGDDDLDGGAGEDILYGAGGDDTLTGGADNDEIYGDDGVDTAVFSGNRADYTITALASDRWQVVGADGTDVVEDVEFLQFADQTVALSALNPIDGTPGPDNLNGTPNADHIQGFAGADTLLGQGGDDLLEGGDDGDFLSGDAGNDVVRGNGGDDFVRGRDGDDTLDGGDGFDRAAFSIGGTDSLNGATVDLNQQGVAQDTGHGLDTLIGIEHVSGTQFDDVLTGDGGANWLWGGSNGSGFTGTDTIDGGGGDDLIQDGQGDHSLSGGDGVDTVSFNGNGTDIPNGVTVDLDLQGAAQNTGVGNMTLSGFENVSGTGFADSIGGDSGANVLAGGDENDTLNGEGGNDLLLGDGAMATFSVNGFSGPIQTVEDQAVFFNDANYSGNDTLNGGEGDDRLVGGGGDDLLNGGVGNDVIEGGAGIDTVSYAGATSRVNVNLNTATQQNTLGAGLDTLSGVENAIGSDFNDTLIARGSGSVLTGGLGDDALVGLGSADTFIGGEGGRDVAINGMPSANWTVDLALAGPQATGQGLDSFSGIEGLIGNGGVDTFAGDDGDNYFEGRGGNDVIDGRDGIDHVSFVTAVRGVTVNLGISGVAQVVDSVSGETETLTSIEWLGGSTFDDFLTGSDGDDGLFGGLGNDVLDGGDGNDFASYFGAASGVTVNLSITTSQDTGAMGFDTLTNIEYLFGSLNNDTLTGNSGDNLIGGDQGNDTLDGGDGVDGIYFGSSTAISGITFSLALQGTAQATGGAGTDTATNFENIIGSKFDDSLDGDDGDNSVVGGGGDDVLSGGDGDDRLVGDRPSTLIASTLGEVGDDSIDGGAGTDTAVFLGLRADYTVTQVNATTWTVTGPDGSDTVANVEFLEFDDETIALQNIIEATTNDDLINGTPGSDYIDGLAGNDVLRGQGGNDELLGGEGHDQVRGNAGDDVVRGGDGNDYVQGGAGDDTIDGGDGNDRAAYFDSTVGVTVDLAIQGVAQDTGQGMDTLIDVENVSGSQYSDTLSGNDDANWITGSSGGDDFVDGRGGNDALEVGDGAHTVIGGDGIDSLGFIGASAGVSVSLALQGGVQSTGVGSVLATELENLSGSTFDDTLTGDNEANTLAGDIGADVLNGGEGDDALFGDGALGPDTIPGNLSGPPGAFIDLAVRYNDDSLAADDILNGGDGNDFLAGGGGNDTLDGGAGNLDTAYFDGAKADYEVEFGPGGSLIITDTRTGISNGVDTVSNVEQFQFSDGFFTYAQVAPGIPITLAADTVLVTSGQASSILASNLLANDGSDPSSEVTGLANITGATVSLVAGRLVITATGPGPAGFDYIVTGPGGVQTAGRATITTVATSSAVDTVSAGAVTAADLQGQNGNDTLTGSAGQDRLLGGLGNDNLNGAGGVDELIGGGGNDAYVIDDPADTIVELAGEGTDTVTASISYTLGAEIEHLTLVGAALNATGNGLANTLTGNGLNNVLDGGAGADILRGGAGDDTYLVDDAGDSVQDLGGGVDTVVTTLLSYTLAAAIENLTYNGSGNFTGVGTTLANVITGGSGNDTLDGGAGNDTLTGGLGDDLYIVGQVGDVVVEASGQGTDTIQTAVTYTIGETVFVERIEATGVAAINLTGNSQANVLVGNGAANVLNGGAGADAMTGGGGNDTYVVDNAGDNVTELAAGGDDLVEASVDYTLSAEVERLTLTGAAIAGTGNGLANTITGNAAANVLDGGAGVDTLIGGLGDDTYRVDVSGDVVTEVAGQGTDTVQSTAASYTLALNVENLTFVGIGAFSGTGNGGNNVIVGGAAADTLNGMSGDDVLDGGLGGDAMDGGAGNDSYYVDDDLDTIADSSGVDTVFSMDRTYTLGGTLENLTFINTGNSNLNGNALANVITGGSGTDTVRGFAGNDTLVGNGGNDNLQGGDGNDILNGGLGADTMTGGLNDDTYYVDDAGDVVTEAAGQGTADRVRTTLSTYVLAANVEQLIYDGSASFTGTGNSLDNLITGGGQADTLSGDLGADAINGGAGTDSLFGGDGNDTLDGGTDADTLTGGIGNDVYLIDNAGDVIVEVAGQGTDTARVTAASYVLGAEVETMQYVGAASFNGTGNALGNTIIGGAFGDELYGAGGADTMRGGNGTDAIYGGTENDKLYGEDGADALFGDAGNDFLYGGAGVDGLTGGAGKDYFVLSALTDSGVGAGNRDVILDYDTLDVMDLRAIDPIAGGADDAFVLIGTGAFTNVAGQLRYYLDGGNTIVAGDVNGDGVADFEIQVNGTPTINGTDFLL